MLRDWSEYEDKSLRKGGFGYDWPSQERSSGNLIKLHKNINIIEYYLTFNLVEPTTG